MHNKKKYLFGILILLVVFTWFYSDSKNNNKFKEETKVTLRSIGNDLLLTNNDSISLVLPIIALEKSKYQLSFEKQLFIQPDSLVNIVALNFKKANLSNNYIVEVLQCTGNEVAYSFKVKNTQEKSIIPCSGRILPKSCYTINVRLNDLKETAFNIKRLIYFTLFLLFIFLSSLFMRKRNREKIATINGHYIPIGSFQFYPEQHKLIKEIVEISLSKKECEILAIFIEKPNQIIKREELVKKVWEDQGVIVGRSLDTYISKLRKKLKADESVNLINVHGVGYKLEIE
jgi:hypothetical protein